MVTTTKLDELPVINSETTRTEPSGSVLSYKVSLQGGREETFVVLAPGRAAIEAVAARVRESLTVEDDGYEPVSAYLLSRQAVAMRSLDQAPE